MAELLIALTPVIEALLSSLLPGLALTALIWAGLTALPRLNAATRHLVWLGTLLAVAALPLLSLLGSDRPPATVPNPDLEMVTPLQTVPATPGWPSASAAATSHPAGSSATPPAWHLPPSWRGLLIGLYAGGLLLFALRFAVSFLALASLKRRAARVGEAIPLSGLAISGTARPVRVLRSRMVTMPLVAGLLRPAILLPPDLERTLGHLAFEHVVLHELAHLARRDDWTKLLQKFIHTILFFHPAVHLIGRRLDLERELASDDWVVATHGQAPRSYAASLARLAALMLAGEGRPSPLEGSAVLARTRIETRIARLLVDRGDGSRRASRLGVVALLGLLPLLITVILRVAPQAALAQPGPAATASLVELTDLEQLRAQFNRDAGSPRLLLLFSPTCPICIAGARFVQRRLLAQNPDTDIEVYAIWFEMLPGDRRERWDPDLLSDPRVRHYWDEGKLVGRRFAEASDIRGAHPPVAWDLYALYGPEAVWQDPLPEPLLSAGVPVVNFQRRLRTTVAAFPDAALDPDVSLDELAGSWQTAENDLMLVLSDLGRYQLAAPAAGAAAITERGLLTLEGSRATLRTTTADHPCLGVSGSYDLTWTPDLDLTWTLVEDPCAARIASLTGRVWTQPAP